ncbi:MAG: autotransporter domain-containing protein [Chitinophaga sp.]|uniref:hypothetical protein n=1 Tax=Chitinophaga sp. TaxID=1869181 RepID=UPI001B05E51A|nr:hypothetical protein [Chitinophaga sp.]MBO9732708.1 autotransporter domain-containing protein [Chitinophaga sp.]
MKKLLLVVCSAALMQGVSAQTKDFPAFRISVNGGYSYRLGKIGSQFNGEARDYLKKLKSGFNIGADATYYFQEKMGVGLKYSRFHASNSGVFPIPGGNVSTSDNISINFIGAIFGTRLYNKAKTNAFYANVGLGYLGFRNNSAVAINKMILKGGTAGTSLDLGYDFRITRYLSAGAQASLITGTLSSIKIEQSNGTSSVDLKDDEKENLTHLNLSAGIRFTL